MSKTQYPVSDCETNLDWNSRMPSSHSDQAIVHGPPSSTLGPGPSSDGRPTWRRRAEAAYDRGVPDEEVRMDDPTDDAQTLSDEDITTVSGSVGSSETERPPQDADGTDTQDADDQDSTDKKDDQDSTDTRDRDGTDSQDTDSTDKAS